MDSVLVDRILELAVRVQQIPAPTFHEFERAELILRLFQEEGLEEVSMDEIGNVYGCLKGIGQHKPLGQQRPLVISAHTDTVFPKEVDLKVRHQAGKIFGPGIGDNAIGVAGLLGLLWMLRQEGLDGKLPGDLWLVANVGEEGLGNLRGMRAVVNRFGSEVLAYVVLEGTSLGQVYNRALGAQRYRITVKTPGGHSWVNYGQPSAVHELAKLVTFLANLSLPREPRTTLNIGLIHGGTSVNTIAAEASCELDLRSENSKTLAGLVRQVQEAVESANREKVIVTSTLIGQRPGGKIPATHPLVQAAVRSLEANKIRAALSIGSTDANIPLSLGIPSVCVAVTKGGGAHSSQEFIYTLPVIQGMTHLCMLVEGIFATFLEEPHLKE